DDVRPPGGESLADTAARVLPYWESRILPDIKAGRNVLVVAHGNSLRALVMHLDGLTPEQVVELEIPTGVPLLYEMTRDGTVVTKRYLLGSAAARAMRAPSRAEYVTSHLSPSLAHLPTSGYATGRVT